MLYGRTGTDSQLYFIISADLINLIGTQDLSREGGRGGRGGRGRGGEGNGSGRERSVGRGGGNHVWSKSSYII